MPEQEAASAMLRTGDVLMNEGGDAGQAGARSHFGAVRSPMSSPEPCVRTATRIGFFGVASDVDGLRVRKGILRDKSEAVDEPALSLSTNLL